jgi:HD-GYP domain-containing protein (c-di-GMP phosphodiesterase class II)
LARAVLSLDLGLPFFFFDPNSGDLIGVSAATGRGAEPPAWIVDVVASASRTEVSVVAVSDLLNVVVVPLDGCGACRLLAVGVAAVGSAHTADESREVAGWLDGMVSLDDVRYCEPELLRRLGETARFAVRTYCQLQQRENELQQLASQVARNYEEITLLHQLTGEAQVAQGVGSLQELTLTLLADLVPASQIAFVATRQGDTISHGDAVLDSNRCLALARALTQIAPTRPVVVNHVAGVSWLTPYPEIRRLVAVPVSEADRHFGWLLALAAGDGPELGSIEASLMAAVARILATHQTNVTLFENIKDLFLSVVHSLSAAIDAKDPYTCGHSARVARAARRIGQAMGLCEAEQDKLYLSGLLHDIGKIGIRDAVLLKPGRLDAEELAHIQEHPAIGYEILSGVRQLRPILAGVRNHHENYDGTGYPDGLAGDQIPLMARIIAVADSFDAMSSDRPYRRGMAAEQVERILREGTHKQWDQRVVEAFLTVHDGLRRQLPPLRAASGGAQHSYELPASHEFDLNKLAELITWDAAEAARS